MDDFEDEWRDFQMASAQGVLGIQELQQFLASDSPVVQQIAAFALSTTPEGSVALEKVAQSGDDRVVRLAAITHAFYSSDSTELASMLRTTRLEDDPVRGGLLTRVRGRSEPELVLECGSFLTDISPMNRRLAASILLDFRNKEADQYLEEFSADPLVNPFFLGSLARDPANSMADSSLAQLREGYMSPEMESRLSCGCVLAMIGDTSYLIEHRFQGDEKARGQLMIALAQCAPHEYRTIAIGYINDPSPKIRQSVVFALVGDRSTDSLRALVKLSKDESAMVRLHVPMGLAIIDSSDARRALRRLRSDPDRNVASESRRFTTLNTKRSRFLDWVQARITKP